MAELEPKTDRRILRSKEALRRALLELMERKSFSSVSITEIVELANYNRGTFYTHYESKEMLLDDIIADLIQDLLRSFRAPYESSEVFCIKELSANSVLIFDHFYQHRSLYTMLLKSDVLPKVKEIMLVSLKNILTDELLLEENDDQINQELHVVYSMHALLGLVFYWIEHNYHYSPAYMQEQLVKIINARTTSAKNVSKSRGNNC